MSDYVEKYDEFIITRNITKIFLDNAINENKISPDTASQLMVQLNALDNITNFIANYVFMSKRNLKKQTTSSNECRHKNFNYGGN